MRLAVFGATGDPGSACVTQALAAGHQLTVHARSPDKLSEDVRARVALVQGDALVAADVRRTLRCRATHEMRDAKSSGAGTHRDSEATGGADPDAANTVAVDAVLFCIGVDRHSPENLCTNATRIILEAMRSLDVRRFVWCGGGSHIVDDDVITLGARFVRFFASTFMGLRHRDKEHQLALLERSLDVDWVGVRPLQMKAGPHRGEYRLGFHAYSALSSISFADCADAMLTQLTDDRWIHKAPIVSY